MIGNWQKNGKTKYILQVLSTFSCKAEMKKQLDYLYLANLRLGENTINNMVSVGL